MRAILLAVVIAAGCIEPNLVRCGDLVCPADTVCSPSTGTCVERRRLDACVGIDPGASCQVSETEPGECIDGLCIGPTCGDGLVSGAEDCEPATPLEDVTCADLGYYKAEGLLCSSTCRFDTSQCSGGLCGDGVVDEPEGCDGEPAGGLACFDFGFDSGTASCSSACNAMLDNCRRHGWRIVEASRSGTILWVGADGQVFTKGNGADSDFYRFDGTTWHSYNLGPVRALWGASSSSVFAVGDQGLIKRFDGAAWTLLPSPVQGTLTGVGGTTDSNVYAWGPSALLHFDGSAWQSVATPFDSIVASAVASDGAVIVAGIASGTLRLDYFDGATWSPLAPRPWATVIKVWAVSSSDIYAIERLGPFGSYTYATYHFDGNGWSELFAGELFDALDVWGLRSDDVFVVGRSTVEPAAVSYHFDGVSWQRIVQPELLEFSAIGGNTAELYAGDATALAHSERRAWSSPVVFADLLPHVWADGSGSIILGSNDQVHRYDGTAWESFPTGDFVTSLSVVDFDHIYAGTHLGASVMRYEEGSGWAYIGGAGSGSGTLTALLALANDDIYVAHRPFFSFGTPVYTVQHYNGSGWQTILSTSAAKVKALWGSGAHVIAYDSTTAMHWDGVAWIERKFPAGMQMNAMWGTRHDDVYAVGVAGAIAHFDGSNWTAIGSNTTTDLVAVTGTSSTDIFAAGTTLPRTLMHYDGNRWSPIRPRANPTFRALAISGRDLVGSTAADLLERFRRP